MHERIEKLLESFSDELKVNIIFYVSTDKNDQTFQVGSHLIDMTAQYNSDQIREAMSSWYNMKTKNYQTWSSNIQQ